MPTTPKSPAARDYSMTGANAQHAIDSGLAAARWYHSDVDHSKLVALMKTQSDLPALRDSVILFGVMIASAAAGVALWGSIFANPFFLIYGVLYGSAMDARWHECGHGTAFKTQRFNDIVYQIACFCMIRNPVAWRYSHTRHHRQTIIVGRDPEIAIMRPPQFALLLLNFVGIPDTLRGLRDMVLFSSGSLSDDVKDYVPEAERHKIIKPARAWLIIYLITILTAIVFSSWLPLVLIGLPRLYGAWHHVMTGLLQHGGLAENVIDHRLNTRTVLMNPISRFIYWNMNYHVEHHMFPRVPYHALPKLHDLIKHDLPAPNPSISDAFREMWPALKRQLRDDNFYIKRKLPPNAKPYREEFHQYVPGVT